MARKPVRVILKDSLGGIRAFLSDRAGTFLGEWDRDDQKGTFYISRDGASPVELSEDSAKGEVFELTAWTNLMLNYRPRYAPRVRYASSDDDED